MALYDFLRQLAANNDRPWFAEHKAEYDALREKWLGQLDRTIALIAQFQPEIANQSAKNLAYRIYRDIRFSKDKSPYKTYFSACLHPLGRKSHLPGLYLHMGPEDGGLYAGIWEPSSPELAKLRHAIVDNSDEWLSIVDSPTFAKAFPHWLGSTLKTIPKGWPKDHPMAFYLRMKEFGRWAPIGEAELSRDDWPELVAEKARAAMPFIEFLNYSLTEDDDISDEILKRL